jgi:hypothetical protein
VEECKTERKITHTSLPLSQQSFFHTQNKGIILALGHNYLLILIWRKLMQNTTYIFRFHNPNSTEITASFFLKTAVAANAQSIEEKILHIANTKEQAKTPKRTTFLSTSV